MIRLIQILLRLLLVAIPVLLAMAPAVAQTNNIFVGQSVELSVVEIPGDTYSWEIYNDVNGINFATTSGNCPQSEAVFTGGISTGPVVHITLLKTGTYFFKVTAQRSGCTMNLKVGKITVEIRPVPQIYTSGGSAYCIGTPLKLRAGSYTGQVLTYQWTSPDGTTYTGPEWDLGPLEMSSAGEYKVTAFDGPGSFTTETLNVTVLPEPNVSISDVDSLCSGQEVTLNAAGPGIVTYQWQDGSSEPQLIANSEGIYWVVVSDNNGCTASDSVYLHQCEMLIMMPNAFTPGVGANRTFHPEYRTDVDITFQMYIFNKWGEQVFSTNNINEGWDGKYKGKLCQEDLYTWTIIFSANDGRKFLQKSPQSGTVMLLIK